ncbi:MAG: hypothetical protein GF344_17430, partial [Chitinivibrionales bacterium]|nr:hypothetical protein [Chitinivibrionales bacterium]MBD3358447.1 hypothetical protein [Chitinivibrionales bacterium]
MEARQQHRLLRSLAAGVSIMLAALTAETVAGVIQGFVVDDDTGLPPAEVTVELYDFDYSDTSTALYSTSVRSDGFFAFDPIPDSHYHLKIIAKDYIAQWYDPMGNTSAPEYLVDAMMTEQDTLWVPMASTPKDNTPSAVLEVIMRDDSGAAYAGVSMVELFGMNGEHGDIGTRVNDSVFRFDSLVPSDYALYVYSYDYPSQYYNPEGGTTDPHYYIHLGKYDVQSITMYLTPNPINTTTQMGIITGMVTDSEGNPLAGVRMTASPNNEIDYFSSYPAGMWWPYMSFSDSAGKYHIDGLYGGEYLVAAIPESTNFVCQFYSGADDLESAQSLWVGDSGGAYAADFTLRPGGVLTGRIVTSDDRGVANVGFALYEHNGSHHYRSYTDSLGAFTIEGIAGGSYHHWIDGEHYFVQKDENYEIVIHENQTHTASTITVALGGHVRTTLPLPPNTSDSMWLQHSLLLFDPRNFSDGGVHMPVHTHYLTKTAPSTYTGGPFPPGTWKALLVPQPISERQDHSTITSPFEPNLSYGFPTTTNTSGTPSSVGVTAGDTIDVDITTTTNGYSVFGTVGAENGVFDPLRDYYEVKAFIKEEEHYLCIAESRLLDDGRFELPGLKDGEDYYLYVHSADYPDQFWSPGGNSFGPQTPYTFSTTSHEPLAVTITPNPEGTPEPKTGYVGSSLIDLWTHPTTEGVELKWELRDTTLPIDSMKLVRNIDGVTTEVATVILRYPRDSIFTWHETATTPTESPFVAYVVVGEGKDIRIRSQIHEIDPAKGANVAPGELWINTWGTRHGVVVEWGGDTTHNYGESGYSLLHKKDPVRGWNVLDTCRGWCDWMHDHDIDPTDDKGKTFYYKVEIIDSTASYITPEASFTVTETFIGGLAKRLTVGPHERHTTIQSAVDAANDGDQIAILPGTYNETVDLKGKSVSLEGEWRYGKPPVIDAGGGVAVTVPYPTQSTVSFMVYRPRIEGLRFVNCSEAIRTFSGLEIDNCLFDHPKAYAINVTIDSVAMTAAMISDPFAPSNIYID